jgi:hypothetical protein
MAAESYPPAGFSQIGKNLEEVKVLSLLAICVIERAATHCADNLAARSELDNGERATAFEAFIAALKKEAIEAPLDEFDESDEAGGRASLVGFIERIGRVEMQRFQAL